jgi:hypothetical protein
MVSASVLRTVRMQQMLPDYAQLHKALPLTQTGHVESTTKQVTGSQAGDVSCTASVK